MCVTHLHRERGLWLKTLKPRFTDKPTSLSYRWCTSVPSRDVRKFVTSVLTAEGASSHEASGVFTGVASDRSRIHNICGVCVGFAGEDSELCVHSTPVSYSSLFGRPRRLLGAAADARLCAACFGLVAYAVAGCWVRCAGVALLMWGMPVSRTDSACGACVSRVPPPLPPRAELVVP